MQPLSKLRVTLADNLATAGTIDTIALCVFRDEPELSAAPVADDSLRRRLENLFREGEFKGDADEAALIHLSATTSTAACRLLLLGLGVRADFDLAVLRRAARWPLNAVFASRH